MTGTVPGTAHPDGAVTQLRTTAAIRERAAWLLERARAGDSPWFTVRNDAMEGAAAEVATVTRERYPDLDIPYHSRWRHFEAGGVDRKRQLEPALAGLSTPARARALIDLTVISVLLDAGAGPDWAYRETGGGRYERSEGLAVAGFHAFTAGLFSSDPSRPLRADAAALRSLDAGRLAAAFQAGPANPLVGLEGRVALLHGLGAALAAQPEVFGPDGRPGGLFDALTGAAGDAVRAHDILSLLLATLSAVWPAGNAVHGRPLGDCWRLPAVPGPGLTAGWMPFHKLSQWLTYSLLEPFGWCGVQVEGLDELTGLPEYRNGGLLLDTGVLSLRNALRPDRPCEVGDEPVVEWRALTVALLDELAPLVRSALGPDAVRLPLACVLEGGTWAAGRRLARDRRGGLPPLSIVSDGTVF